MGADPSERTHSDTTCARRHRLWAGSHPPMSCAVGCPCTCHAKESLDVG